MLHYKFHDFYYSQILVIHEIHENYQHLKITRSTEFPLAFLVRISKFCDSIFIGAILVRIVCKFASVDLLEICFYIKQLVSESINCFQTLYISLFTEQRLYS